MPRTKKTDRQTVQGDYADRNGKHVSRFSKKKKKEIALVTTQPSNFTPLNVVQRTGNIF